MTSFRVLTVAALFGSACLSPPVESPSTIVTQATSVRVEQSVKNKVDVLFMIDNSPSMTPKQDQLRAKFTDLIKIFQDFGNNGSPASYHIGVITSDLGANGFTDSLNECHPGANPYGGGQLQAKGRAADTSCQIVTGGVNFIDYNQLNGSDNLPPGQDIPTTFGCMAAVGDTGCGFEQQLEASYKALSDGSINANSGFFRDDALLAVVYVTDEDDCSAPSDQDIYNAMPSSPPPDGLGALASYRCNKWGIVCDALDGSGPKLMPYGAAPNLQNCRPATQAEGGKLFDVSRYINYFTLPKSQGGAKVDPNDVILVAISADPAGGVSSALGNPGVADSSGQPQSCPGPLSQSCQVLVEHSCVAPDDKRFFGDPAVRIKAVVDSATNHQFTSICDTDYTGAIQALGMLIVSQIGAGCLNAPLTDPNAPVCNVEDVQTEGDGSKQHTPIKQCTAADTSDFFPCWRLTANDKCTAVVSPVTQMPEQFGVTIDRGPGGSPPDNTTAAVQCLTIAVTANP